jgi:hypothetical protein
MTLIFLFLILSNLTVIHDPDDPYLNEYDEEIIVTLTDYHHTESEILLKKFLSPSSEGDEVN